MKATKATWPCPKAPLSPGPPPNSASKVYHDPRSTPPNCSMKETIPVTMIIQRSCYHPCRLPKATWPCPKAPLSPGPPPNSASKVYHDPRSTPPNCSMKETIPVTMIIQRSCYHPCRLPKATKATWPCPKGPPNPRSTTNFCFQGLQ